jgi:hypothetical protein
MREKLKERNNERFRVRATVSRLGVRPTVLLINGVDATGGEILFDHLWLTTGTWARIPLGQGDWRAMRPGDVIEFDARSGPYTKGYFGQRPDVGGPPELDWRLMRPTKLMLISEQ